MPKLFFALSVMLLAGLLPAKAAAEPALYLVSFTADWCPNCVILDPRMEEALEQFEESEVEVVWLDMTDADTREASFYKVDGTLLAGVYGDHLGVTGIGILTAADSGEKIGCVTRAFSTDEIIALMREAVETVQTQAPLQRTTGLGSCPAANGREAL